jgi:hypothetical protein
MRRIAASLLALALVAGLGAWAAARMRGRHPGSLGPRDANVARGVFHVHSEMSHDSQLPLGRIVEVAKQAGLDFVVLTDHNEQYAGPFVRDGITVISSAELSTPAGHVIELGGALLLDAEQRRRPEIFQAIRTAGGVPIVTHPSDSQRPWTASLEGAAGVEIVNVASAVRRLGGHLYLGLVPALLGLLVNPELAAAQLYDRDSVALGLWDSQPDPGFVGLCGADAHGWLDLAGNIKAWNVVLGGPLPLDERERPAFILRELRQGRFFCSAGLLGGPPPFRFGAKRATLWVANTGESIAADGVDELVALAPSATPMAQNLVLIKDGHAILKTQGGELTLPAPKPGTYRVEIWLHLPRLLVGEELVPVLYSQRVRVAPAATAPR